MSPSTLRCPLIDARYAAEQPEAALEYFNDHKTLEGVYDNGNCLEHIRRQIVGKTEGKIALHTVLVGAALKNDANLLQLTAKAIRKYGPTRLI